MHQCMKKHMPPVYGDCPILGQFTQKKINIFVCVATELTNNEDALEGDC